MTTAREAFERRFPQNDLKTDATGCYANAVTFALFCGWKAAIASLPSPEASAERHLTVTPDAGAVELTFDQKVQCERIAYGFETRSLDIRELVEQAMREGIAIGRAGEKNGE